MLWPNLHLTNSAQQQDCSQGRINHWAKRGIARGLTLLGASRLNAKTLLYWFFMFLGCSPRVKIAELFDYCV